MLRCVRHAAVTQGDAGEERIRSRQPSQAAMSNYGRALSLGWISKAW